MKSVTRKVTVRVALLTVVALAIVLAREWLTTEKIVLHNDFFQYWSAGRYILAGGNPYEHGAFAAFQVQLGWEGEVPIFTWNPPWALALFLPFALLRYPLALLVWLAVQGWLIVGSVIVAWRHFGGDPKHERSIVLMSLLFPPTILSLWFGQISAWLLVGVILALVGVSRRNGFFVGVALVLLSVKPHFAFLLGLALAIWALRNGPGRTLGGAVTALIPTLAIPLYFRPGIISDYLRMVTTSQPREYVSDTLAAGLRLLVGWEHFWVQFVPLLLGLVWLGLEFARENRVGDPAEDAIPLLALVSALVAPYGWIFDNIVAIPGLALLWLWLGGDEHARQRRSFLVGYGLFSVFLTVFHLWLWHPKRWVHGWLTSLLLATYLIYRQRALGRWVPGGLQLLARHPSKEERPAAR